VDGPGPADLIVAADDASFGYPPARVDHRFKDGDTIRVGPIALTAHVTAGHTRGCPRGRSPSATTTAS